MFRFPCKSRQQLHLWSMPAPQRWRRGEWIDEIEIDYDCILSSKSNYLSCEIKLTYLISFFFFFNIVILQLLKIQLQSMLLTNNGLKARHLLDAPAITSISVYSVV